MTRSDALTSKLVEALRSGRAIAQAAWTGPGSLEEGYAIQAAFFRQAGLGSAGWKAGSTNAAAQARRNLSEPVFGRLFADRCFGQGSTVPRDLFMNPCLEVEFGFRMGRDLGPRDAPFALAEVRAAVDAVVLAIEIADGRLEDWRSCDAPSSVADNVAHGATVLGPEFPLAEGADLASVRTTLVCDGAVMAEGTGSAVLGNPLNALTWLANKLSGEGETLQAGQVVLSGTTSALVPVGSCRTVTAGFSGLGEVSFAFAPPDAGDGGPVTAAGA